MVCRNAELMALLLSSLEASAKRKLETKGVLDPDDEPPARLDAFRGLSARYRVGTVPPGDYFRIFQEIFGVEDSWVGHVCVCVGGGLSV